VSKVVSLVALAMVDELRPESLLPPASWNTHAQQRRLFEDRVLRPFRASRWNWSALETEQLKAVVFAQLQEGALRQRFQTRTAELDLQAPDRAQERRKIFLELCSELKEGTLEELMEEHGQSLDWMCIAGKMSATVGCRFPHRGMHLGAASCKIHFHHAVQTSRAVFGAAEDACLLEAVKEMGLFDWDCVAERLGTGRTAWQCFTRYWRRLRVRAEWKWSEHEDRRLQHICRETGPGNDWDIVKKRFGDGPTQEECMLRWLRNRSAVQGRWLATSRLAVRGGGPLAPASTPPRRAVVRRRARWCSGLWRAVPSLLGSGPTRSVPTQVAHPEGREPPLAGGFRRRLRHLLREPHSMQSSVLLSSLPVVCAELAPAAPVAERRAHAKRRQPRRLLSGSEEEPAVPATPSDQRPLPAPTEAAQESPMVEAGPLVPVPEEVTAAADFQPSPKSPPPTGTVVPPKEASRSRVSDCSHPSNLRGAKKGFVTGALRYCGCAPPARPSASVKVAWRWPKRLRGGRCGFGSGREHARQVRPRHSSSSSSSSSSTFTSTYTTTSADGESAFACESEELFWTLEAMESKGLCLDDVSFRDCAGELPTVWPNTKFSPVKTLRLYRPWDSSWGSEYLRTKAWTKLVDWVKENNVRVVLGTEVTCNQMNDEEMWFWNIELMKLLGKDHVMGVAVGNEMDMFRATGASEETACSDELWESRYWDTLKRRVNDLDLNGFLDTKVTAAWSMGVLGAVETPFKEDGTAKANTLVKKAYEKWPHRWVWTFNTYSIWDRSLWPSSTQECVEKTKEAVDVQPVQAVLAEVRRRIKMITGNDDDPLWIGEIGWASPAPQSLSEALDVCPDFGSVIALRDAYKNFLAWDLSMDRGLKGPDHAFYYTIRDDPKRGSGFGLMGSCKERQCKVQKEGLSSLKLKFV